MSHLPLYQAEYTVTNPTNNLVSTADTISKMIGLVNESVAHIDLLQIGQEIIQGVGRPRGEGATELDYIRGVYWWVKHHVHFKEDEYILTQDFGLNEGDLLVTGGKELLLSPTYLLSMPVPTGDCDDFSTLLATLLKIVGFQRVGFRTIAASVDDPEAFTHVYVIVGLNSGEVMPLDASHGGYPGWEHAAYKIKDWWI